MRDIGTLKTIQGIPGRHWVCFWRESPFCKETHRVNVKVNVAGILNEGAPAVVIQHDDRHNISQVLSHRGLVWIHTGDMQ
jgi:hypothetical protein